MKIENSSDLNSGHESTPLFKVGQEVRVIAAPIMEGETGKVAERKKSRWGNLYRLNNSGDFWFDGEQLEAA